MKKHRRSNIKHALAAVLFFAVLSLGLICFADAKGTVIVKSAVIRASADPNSAKLASVLQGGNVDIIEETTGTDGKAWYHVYVDADTKGYIRKDLVKLKDGETVKKTQSGSASTTTDSPTTAVTAVDAKKASVISNRTNIRQGASTDHKSVATANRGAVLTITGETAGSDGKKWYQVSLPYGDKEVTGFIRSDLVTFDNVPADAATSEITGEGSGGEEVPETQPEETTPPEPEPEPAEPAGNTQVLIPMNADKEPAYIMPGFKAFNLTLNEQSFKAYKNGQFFIYYAQNQNGEQGWYLFDSELGTYQRYVYEVPDVTVPDSSPLSSAGLLPVIVLVAIVIVLIAVVGLLVLKLRGRREYDDLEEEYDDESYSDDVEDIGEEEDEEDNEEEVPRPPIRRPQPVRSSNNAGPQPMRRPQPQGQGAPQGRPQGPQPVRRPQPQGQSVPQTKSQGPQPIRRPQPQGSGAPLGHPQGQQPMRRPQPQGQSVPQGVRPSRPTVQGHPQSGRPQPQGHPQGRRPQPPNDRPQPQKSSKARVPSEHDDDMDFMDI